MTKAAGLHPNSDLAVRGLRNGPFNDLQLARFGDFKRPVVAFMPWAEGYRAAQNEQWCLVAKSVSICSCAGTSDMMWAMSKDGQASAADDGSPVDAKFAHAVRMLAARAS